MASFCASRKRSVRRPISRVDSPCEGDHLTGAVARTLRSDFVFREPKLHNAQRQSWSNYQAAEVVPPGLLTPGPL
jgi:hypothetical protein